MSVAVDEGSSTVINPVEERCDRCGARGYVKSRKGQQFLVFCHHHSNEFGANMMAQGWVTTAIALED